MQLQCNVLLPYYKEWWHQERSRQQLISLCYTKDEGILISDTY